MLPKNFNFALIPRDIPNATLKEIGMLSSTLEDIDAALVEWLKKDLDLRATTNEGWAQVPVLWQAPERAYQIKNEKQLRDDGGTLKLPLVSIERTTVSKDPEKKGSFQANLYSEKTNGRSGRVILAKQIVPDKTRNFAVATGVRNNTNTKLQRHYPRVNKKIVVRTLSIPIPVYVNVDYKISIKTEYQQQMNEIVMPFLGRTGQINSFVMRRNGHLYEAFIDANFAQNNNMSNLGTELRTFSTDITINVLGYLIGEGPNDERPLVEIRENVVEVTYPRETVAMPGMSNIFGNITKGSS
tara:strand:+ start:226 stop:1119 length:894 start_codon:yes stop_codon:yes gene_type:complete